MKNLVHNFCDCATCEKNQEKAEKYEKFFKDFDKIRNYQQIIERLKKININELISNYLHQSPELTKQFEELQKSLGDEEFIKKFKIGYEDEE